MRDWLERIEATKNRRRFGTKLVSILDQLLVPCWGRFSIHIRILALFSVYRFTVDFGSFFTCLEMRAAVVATPLLFTDVRFTSTKHRSVTTLALNLPYYFNIFFGISA